MKTNFYTHLIATFSFIMFYHVAFSQSGNYFSGTSAGSNNTTGSYNSFAGYGAGLNNTTGSFNTALGFYAGSVNETTGKNTSIGAYAGYFTSGSFGENVFVGYGSGFTNSNGFYNVFLGANTGYKNNSGSYNTFVGHSAGDENTSGLSNTFVGWASGSYNTTAGSNTFIGNLSGYKNTTGGSNSFLGSAAGYSNISGTNNAFFGARAGYYTTSSNNTFLGKSAGEKNTTGGVNTFVGSEAGFNNTSGYNNTFLGRNAGQNNTSAHSNTFVGRSAGANITTGSANTSIGFQAGPSTGTLANATAIGAHAYVTTANSLVLGSISGTNGATADTKVGIRTTAPAYNLHVNGSAAKPGGGAWTAASDSRLKQNIEEFHEGIETLSKIRPVSFKYNGKAGLPTDKKYVGVIAQEMQKILPTSVGEFRFQDAAGKQETYLDFDATALTYILVNAAKELKKENDLLKEQNAAILNELAAIKKLVYSQFPVSGDVDTRLYQNVPNPSVDLTTIKYQVPEDSKNVSIKVFTTTGVEIKSFEIVDKPRGEVTLSHKMLSAGTYLYSLYVDGVKRDTKKLILTQ